MTVVLDPEHIVAEREVDFEPLAPGAAHQTVSFRLGRPVEGQIDWYCPFEVRAFGEVRVDAAHGADSMQALLLALAKLRVVLGALAMEHGGRLEFGGRVGAGLPSLFEEAPLVGEASDILE